MADLSTCLPLKPESIRQTHQRIKQYVHRTPVITSRSINKIASVQDPRVYLSADPPGIWSDMAGESTGPKVNLYFKCENHQKIGAFKARGAFSAITHLASEPDSTLRGIGLDTLRSRGVITHSSGNHAQALALAASTLKIPAWIVMPSISTKSKISGTKGFSGVNVVFSGSTSTEREAKVQEVIDEQKRSGGKGPILVPPYDHFDIMLGQGTAGMELEEQYQAMKTSGNICSAAAEEVEGTHRLDAVLTPVGGGGLLSGTAIWYSHTNDGKKTLVFGCEPNFEGANDIEKGLGTSPPKRIETVKTLTIADGLRTPAGEHPWTVISDKNLVAGVYSVSEQEIKMALKLMMERMKVFVEPSSAVPLAVVLFNQKFRQMVAEKQNGKTWDVGIVISGGNTTVEAVSKLFGEGWMEDGFELDRQSGQVGMDGERVAENVAG